MSSSFSSIKKPAPEFSSLVSSINRNQEEIRSSSISRNQEEIRAMTNNRNQEEIRASSETIKNKVDRLNLGFVY